MMLHESKRNELETLRQEIAEIEADERDRQREKDLMEKRIRQRLEMIDAYQEHMDWKARSLQKEKEEEALIRAEVRRHPE